MNIFIKVIILGIMLMMLACSPQNENKKLQDKLGISLVDSNATYGTVALYYNLKKISEDKIIFGHHHATAYGIGWRGDYDRSDIKDVIGVHPGLIGWDFEDFPVGRKLNEDDWLIKLVTQAHEHGIVNIFAWHMQNLVTGNNFYDTTVAVRHIIPGGSHHALYKKELDRIAHYAKHLIDKNGKVIPFIFRPFHEFDGSWFWWGKNFCTREEFIALWQFTIEYLRDYRKVHNIIYAFSPDRNFHNEEEYFERYPGDEYVDLLGTDNYWDFKPEGEGLSAVTEKLKIISRLAAERNKISAFTETGSEKIPNHRWWTDELLKVIDDEEINLAFVMVWRNDRLNHFYAPYKGDPSSENFTEFKNNDKIIFADGLPDLFNVDLSLSNR